jgi:hypothetical protein
MRLLRFSALVVLAALALPTAPPVAAQQGSLIDPKLLDPNTWYAMAGRAMASAIQIARDETLKAGTQPIPPAIKAALAQAFPAEMLERVTYRVGKEGSLAIQAFQYGDIQAMTLIDVIVFQKEQDALTNAGLWAHELTHVRQYDAWGVEEFARRYTQNYKEIEDEAYGFQAQFEQKMGAKPPAAPRG